MVQNQNKSVPELRFKGFSDAWVQRKFGELYKKVTEKNDLSFGKDKIISVANMYFKTDESRSDDAYMRTYNIFRVGDIAFEGHSSKQFAYGRFVENTIGDGIVSHIFDVFRPISNYDLKYWKYAIINEQIMGRILMTSTTQSTMMNNLVSKDFLKRQLAVPSYEEQAKIGAFLESLDKLIAANQRKVHDLKQLKNAYLERIFNQTLRFSSFTRPWVQRKFEELLDAKEGVRRGPFGSALKKGLFVDSSDYVVYEQQNAIYDQYETRYNITEEKFNELKKFEILPGDYIMSGAGTIGRISEVPYGIKRGVFNQALIRIRINQDVTNKEYFLSFMRGDIMQRKLTGANPGSAITNLVPMSEVKKYDIAIPSIDEQAKIGSLLTTLDNLITANQRKIDLLQKQKTSYLQSMFI
ncbi:restriction endonuclease subunit S [Weissella sp. MSCH1]|uniref:restriction endonuclease subunit S n=1 Tax=Weissella sp. MSCH1 TaxID=3383343 RepID=UPI003896C7A4